MFLSLFSSNNIFDLLGSFSFWIFVAIAVILGFVIVTAIKYPRVGGPVLLVIFTLGILVFTGYCVIQLNYYYTSEGGIHGKLTGIFKTNEIEVVDDLSFEMTNIELTEKSPGIYSASVSLDKSISLDTKQSLGVFVNGMPCDISSEVHEDFAIANYVYTFYDNDKTLILTDTLTMNFAFYDNSTYFELSTSGGADAVKYWHYYFNKNGFVVTIAPFNNSDNVIHETSGNISNYAIVTYMVESEVRAVEVYSKGDKLNLIIDLGIEDFMSWQYNDSDIVSGHIVTEDMIITAKISSDYDVVFDLDGYVFDSQVVSLENTASTKDFLSGVREVDDNYTKVIDYWTLDGETKVDVETYPIVEDTIFYAVWHKAYNVVFVSDDFSISELVAENSFVTIPELPVNFVLECFEVSGVEVDISEYLITADTVFSVIGYYEYTVNFIFNNEIVEIQNVLKGNCVIVPQIDFGDNLTFLGWSLDGINVIDISGLQIFDNMVFIAVFNNTEYSLNLLSSPVDINTITGFSGDVINLGVPSYKDYDFIRWEILDGDGYINPETNEFTFGTFDCSLIAIYNYCNLRVSSDENFEILHTDNTSDSFEKESGFIEVSCTFEESYSGRVTLTISATSGDLILTLANTENVTITRLSNNSFIVEWTETYLINLEFTSSNISYT